MAETPAAQIWIYRGLLTMLAFAIMLFELLPFMTADDRWLMPNITLALLCAWAVRRPEFTPPLLIAGVILLEDLLLQRPPGLLAALSLLALEWLKQRSARPESFSLALEYLSVTGLVISIALANRLILALVLTPQPAVALALALSEILTTLLFYPVAIAVSHFLLGVRKPHPRDGKQAQGARL
jgi:rod shape-determining protein MreD